MSVDSTLLQSGYSTGGYVVLPLADQTRSTMGDDVGSMRTQVRRLDGDVRALQETVRANALDQRCRELSKVSVTQLLATLNELGFAWKDIARMVGVSVPALQKWRRGESITGENRLKLATVLAIVKTVQDEMLVNDPASWFEMPIKPGVSVTPIDLVSAHKPLLIIELASEHDSPDGVLDRYDKNWREKFVDSVFETFIAADGIMSIRPRS